MRLSFISRTVDTFLGRLTVDGHGTKTEPHDVLVAIRPEQIEVTTSADGRPPPSAQGVVVAREFYGHNTMLTIELGQPADTEVVVRLHGPTVLPLGSPVELRVHGAVTVWRA